MTKTSHVHVLLLLIMTLEVSAGGFGSNWNVSYSPTHICALEGSSVQMSCSYTYPSYSKVTEASWINQNSFNTADLSKDKRYTHRVRVDCGDKRSQCSLLMTNLTKTDAQYQYYCRIITDYQTQRQIGTPGISLSVTNVVSFGKESDVREGDHVTLTCNTTCNLTSSPSFIWSKDGRPVEKKQIINNQLQLHPVSYEDEGNYTCAVRGHEDLPSPSMKIKVMSNHSSADNNLMIVALIGVVVCGVVGLFCVICLLRSHMRNIQRTEKGEKQDDVEYSSINFQRSGGQSRAAGPPSADGAGGADDDIQYASVQLNHFRQTAGAKKEDAQYASVQLNHSRQTAGGAGDHVLYACAQPKYSRQTAGGAGDDVQYASVQFEETGAVKRSLDQPEGELSVIYSSVGVRE